MTATANKQDRNCIKDSLGLKDCKEVIGNPDRTNVFYQKIFRHGNDMESSGSILKPIAKKLFKRENKVSNYGDISSTEAMWICLHPF